MQRPRAADLRAQAGPQNIRIHVRQRMKVDNSGGMDNAAQSRERIAEFREERAHSFKIGHVAGNYSYGGARALHRLNSRHGFVRVATWAKGVPSASGREAGGG